MARLDSKVALITGGAVGLGKAIAQRLKTDGARVVISDIQADLGKATAAECGFTFVQQDVSDEAQWSALIERIETEFGHLDILVNNAGIVGPQDALNPENTRLADWKRIFAVNVEGVFLGCKAALPALRRAGGGCIVNLSSVAGLFATPYATAYGASKATVRQLTKSVAQHCAEQKNHVRCNSIHPSDVLTPLWVKLAEESAKVRGVTVEQIMAEGAAFSPMGEFTTPEDIAAGVAYLVSDDARHVTGIELIIDGGMVNCDTYHLMGTRKGVAR